MSLNFFLYRHFLQCLLKCCDDVFTVCKFEYFRSGVIDLIVRILFGDALEENLTVSFVGIVRFTVEFQCIFCGK